MAQLLLRGTRVGDGLDRVDNAPLGEILIRSGALSPEVLNGALAAQQRTGLRIGEILRAQGHVTSREICEALALQCDLGTVDTARDPPDAALFDPADADAYIDHKILPWRQLGGIVTYIVTDPAAAPDALAALKSAPPFAFFALVPPEEMRETLTRLVGPALAERAATTAPEAASVRSLDPNRRRFLLGVFAAFLAMILAGPVGIAAGLLALFLVNAITTGLRLAALLARRGEPLLIEKPPDVISLAGRRKPPKISLLVPVYREAGVLGHLLTALERIDYPAELTQICLLVEEDDVEMWNALDDMDLPARIEILSVPDGMPRTKPRALNHALSFIDGEIIGIIDAEDRPEPRQFTKVAEILRNAPPEIACVQCQLGFFNVTENWISRCFQIEYSIWFEVLLRGFQRLRFPVPLGGTSVYFRRSALISVGAWDAHNVTEDADLGMRLARAGMGCHVAGSVTEEEANFRLWPWIRQRSRWLKGYLLTWLSHMREPALLWRELGPRGFLALNVLFLGAAVSYLAAPLFWIAVFGWIALGDNVWSEAVPGWAIWPAGISLALGQGVMLACAVLALRRRGSRHLLGWVALMPFYWALGAVAAWKAVFEVVVDPFYWDKTSHGVTRLGPETESAEPAPDARETEAQAGVVPKQG